MSLTRSFSSDLKILLTMARWGSLMDVIFKNNPSLNGQFVPGGLFSATLAASSAAAVAASTPFAYRALFGVDGTRAASCDAGPIFTDDFLTGVRTASLNYITKEYSIELKPLFSAFEMKQLALTTIHSFSSNYSDVLQHILQDAEGRDDERHVDLVLPFWNSVNQILRDTSIVTTRRVLERFVVHHCSKRAVWKLLKDLPESALRKSKRGMPFYTCTFCVARTTFRGNFLGVAASCLVRVGIECYHFVRDIVNSENEGEDVHQRERARVLGRRVCGVTVRCVATLVFASIGAGIGAALFRPTTGQSYGYLLGELVGPSIATYCIAHVPYLEL